MPGNDWQRIWDLFHRAVDLEEAQREAFLIEQCGADIALHDEVMSLIGSRNQSDDFLENPAHPGDREDDALPGQCIGDHRIEAVIGSGGMGTVYLARDESELKRPVALKVIKRGMDSRQVIARFEAERQTLALMNHAHIAAIHGAGTTEDGRPYFVMELVRGEPIDRFCDTRNLDTVSRLALVQQACSAVQHAHQRGVIHRDLKPSNVLVAESDGNGVVKIIDFGVAKAIDQRASERSVFTQFGQIVGTPEYMSPEQASGSGELIDTRTDVYSLGVLMYQLLVGTLPFDRGSLRGAGYAEIQRLICEQEPPTPSHRFRSMSDEQSSRVARQRSTQPAAVARELKGDLDWITMKALAKEPDRRYQAVSDLAADLSRFLRHEPVLAGPPDAAYRLKKFIRRHRIGVAVSVMVGVLSITFAISLGVQVVKTRQALERAEQEGERAREVTRFLIDVFEVSDPNRALGQELTAREVLDEGARRVREELEGEPLLRIQLMEAVSQVYHKLGLFMPAREIQAEALALRRSISPEDSMELAESVRILGLLHRELGEYEEAESLYREVLEIRTQLFGPESPEVSTGLNNLGVLLRARGKAREAEEVLLQVRDLQERLGDQIEHVSKSALHNNLGGIYKDRGDYRAAETHYRQALAIRIENESDTPLTIAGARNNLGSLLFRKSVYRGAEEQFQATLDLYLEVLGEAHPETATALNNLASSLSLQGRIEESMPLTRRALAIRIATLGEDHIEVGVARYNLGRAHANSGHSGEAIPLYRQALLSFRNAYGAGHARIGIVLNALALAEVETGALEAASESIDEAFEIARNTWPDGHPVLADSLSVMARLALLNERHDEAEDWAQQCLAMRQAVLEAGDWRIASAQSQLGEIRAIQGQVEDGRALLVQGHQGLESHFGTEDRRTQEAVRRLDQFSIDDSEN